MEKTGRLAPGTILAGFRIVKKIDEGGMGEVYEAADDALGRRIAIKILLEEQLSEVEALNRFKAEGRALAQLNHPNVVKLHIVGQSESMHYMAMEYIDGSTLDDHLAKYNCGLPDIMELFRQMVEGLHAAHELDIVHRDIKPQNIMVDRVGKVKLVDFGIAKAQTEVDDFKTRTGIVLGTRSFLAPEVLRGLPATKQADIYSMGLMFKFMLTGEMPQISPSTDGTVRTDKHNILFPRALTNLLQGMIHASKEMRYHSLTEVLRDLKLISFKDFHPDLMAAIPKTHLVEDLSKVYERCRQRGLDLTESRMAVSLAAKMTGPISIQSGYKTPPGKTPSGKTPPGKTPPASHKTEKIELNAAPPLVVEDEVLNRAIARVKRAKTQVLSSRIGAPQVAMAPPKRGSSVSIFMFLIFLLVVHIGLRLFAPDQLQQFVNFVKQATELPRSPASLLSPTPDKH